MIDIICAWCGADLGQKPGKPGPPTHGMCPACKTKWDAEIEERKKQKEKAK